MAATDTWTLGSDATLGGEDGLGPRLRFLQPFVDRVARIETSVHKKLLGAFLAIAVLLLAMGVVSVAVVERVDGQVDRLSVLYRESDQARRLIYDVTSQSHYRAMAIADTRDPTWTPKIDAAKERFTANLNELRSYALAAEPAFFDDIEETDARFARSSGEVTALFDAGDLDAALDLHIAAEHEVSHDLEDSLNVLIAESDRLLDDATSDFRSDRRFLTIAVIGFSGASLMAALALGAILSWALVSPVRRVDAALGLIAAGDFRPRVSVPNRDEFGRLTDNLNRTTGHLAKLYGELDVLNRDLQQTVDDKVLELERASELRRYMSPQLAASILNGDIEVTLGSKRKYLTTFFSDIRGFTELSERMEPEELVAELNEYLTEMTGLVFEHGGTLDKYIGDALMVFFGDPVDQPDHAVRAVEMAMAMQQRMQALQEDWSTRFGEVFSIGIGISTGWVTVGNIGSPARTDYTVLGNQVNLASRLADRALGGEILVTDRTLAGYDTPPSAALIDEVELKGVSRPVKIYRLEPGRDDAV